VSGLIGHCGLTASTISVHNHHKGLVAQDSKIESANKRLKAAKDSVSRAEGNLLEARKRATADPASEKFKNTLERAVKTVTTAGNAYTKAVDASIGTVGSGSGRVMVLLPTRVVDNTEQE
jgi:hypothetical protein